MDPMIMDQMTQPTVS